MKHANLQYFLEMRMGGERIGGIPIMPPAWDRFSGTAMRSG